MSFTDDLIAAAGVDAKTVVAVEYRANVGGDAWIRVTTADKVETFPVAPAAPAVDGE